MESKSSVYITPKKPVLSASARKIKDNVADWHNLMLKWETYNNDSFNITSKIINLKITADSADKMLLDEALPNKDNITTDKVELDRLCSEVLQTIQNMEKIWTKMEKITATFKGICDLEAYQFPGDISKPTHFHTWPTTLFYEASIKMLNMYKKEMQLKRTIAGDLAHTSDQDLQMVYLSCWLYQPYIDNTIKVLLESMLLETGHRLI
ncbi:cyclin-dependent kinase 2-interacting protein-like [Xenopus laevis]|uniref:Cyclin-dependent kinase 2-interacting protein n=2 Tax=Xenopus laevis TaxID=8355 RepID=A0A974H872_XENLA|nr:cyclin-dependent kinase 2-interacting protein-like [Xenopus laevis]OCT68403.1 hypothetical protein XELAEV_18039703mg [Xenopus laevis]